MPAPDVPAHNSPFVRQNMHLMVCSASMPGNVDVEYLLIILLLARSILRIWLSVHIHNLSSYTAMSLITPIFPSPKLLFSELIFMVFLFRLNKPSIVEHRISRSASRGVIFMIFCMGSPNDISSRMLSEMSILTSPSENVVIQSSSETRS